jgi:hypothetical protein
MLSDGGCAAELHNAPLSDARSIVRRPHLRPHTRKDRSRGLAPGCADRRTQIMGKRELIVE